MKRGVDFFKRDGAPPKPTINLKEIKRLSDGLHNAFEKTRNFGNTINPSRQFEAFEQVLKRTKQELDAMSLDSKADNRHFIEVKQSLDYLLRDVNAIRNARDIRDATNIISRIKIKYRLLQDEFKKILSK